MMLRNNSFDSCVYFCHESNCDYRYQVLHSKKSNIYGIHYVQKCTDIYYSDNIKKLKLKEGFLYLFPSNVEFSISYENESKDNFYEHIWFSFIAMPGLFDSIIEYNVKEIPQLKTILPFFTGITKEYFLQNADELSTARNKLISLLLTILNDITPFKKDENEILEKVIFYVQENLNSELSIEKLSNIAMLNRTYFYKLFTDRMKVSPHKYITDLKILKSKMLLRSDYKISEIAKLVGFNDPKSFSRAFKNHTGYSPQDFKNTDIKFE